MHVSDLSISIPFLIILLVDELVLVEIQSIRDKRPVVPIFEQKFVAEAHRYNLLRDSTWCSCFIISTLT